MLLAGREIPLFDTDGYLHAVAFEGVRREVLLRAGMAPLVEAAWTPGVHLRGMPVHTALCVSEGFVALAEAEQVALVARVHGALRVHANGYGEGLGDIQVFRLDPRDPRQCPRDAGVITAAGVWMPWMTG